MPVFRDPEAYTSLLVALQNRISALAPDCAGLVGTESRGFMLAAPLAIRMKLPFIPLRKPGKLPGHVFQKSFEKEYGKVQSSSFFFVLIVISSHSKRRNAFWPLFCNDISLMFFMLVKSVSRNDRTESERFFWQPASLLQSMLPAFGGEMYVKNIRSATCYCWLFAQTA